MERFTIDQLSFFIIGVSAAVGTCLVKIIGQVEQSRCTNINCCCWRCDRTPTDTLEIMESQPITNQPNEH